MTQCHGNLTAKLTALKTRIFGADQWKFTDRKDSSNFPLTASVLPPGSRQNSTLEPS
jgi:hypothetical protein